jgi:hypothetical protein
MSEWFERPLARERRAAEDSVSAQCRLSWIILLSTTQGSCVDGPQVSRGNEGIWSYQEGGGPFTMRDNRSNRELSSR